MRRRIRGWVAALAVVTLGAPAAVTLVATARPAAAEVTSATTLPLSAASGSDGGRELSALSADGRYAVFVGRSYATQGVYLVDQRTGTTTRLTSGNDMNPAISPDGGYVAFARYGSNRGVYMVNVKTGALTLESVASDGTAASGNSDFPSLSLNGRSVAFQSSATNLGGPTATGGGPNKVYVHDNVAGTTTMASVTSTGQAPNGNATFPRITPDGRYVAFASDASNLLPGATTTSSDGETTAVNQVYVHDNVTGTTTIASVSSAGAVGDTASAVAYGPSISDNGQLVAFESDATNLVPGDTNGVTDAFVHDMATGVTTRVSVNADGTQGIPSPLPEGVDPTLVPALVAGANPQVSGDGSTVAFQSQAPLTGDDTNGVMDVYTYTMATGAIERISVALTGGTEATGTRVDGHTGATVEQNNGVDPSIDVDGRYVSFTSDGNLAADRSASTESEGSFEPAIYLRIRSVPTVTGVTPSSVGLGRRDQTVTITGTNFTPPSTAGDLTVNLGSGVTVDSVTWVSATTLTVTLDTAWNAAPGNRAVGVINPASDTGSMATGFNLTERGTGYRLVASDGGVFAFGDDGFYGSMGGTHLNAPIVGAANTASGDGYWLVASDGGIFAFGDAGFHGSMGAKPLNEPIVGMAPTADGQGYWLVASDGGIFAFGDADFHGSMGAKPLNQPVVGMAATNDQGYWLVAADGGIFAFGDAGFHGSMGAKPLNQPVVGLSGTPSGQGYGLVAADGGIFAFGDAGFYGSMGGKPLNQPVVGLAHMPTGGGYWLVAADGGIFAFGTSQFRGSMGGAHLNAPIVALLAD